MPALHVAPALEVLGGAAVGERRLRAPPPLRLVHADVGERQQHAGDRERHLAHVGGPVPLEHVPRLLDLEPVADREPERRVHRREHAAHAPLEGVADEPAAARQVARVLEVLEKGPSPDLDVEHQGRGPAGDLLAHDAGRDQAVVLDRRR